MPNPLDTINKLDPVFMDHINESNDLVYGEGALSKKMKLLIAMAFDASHGAENGVRVLAQRAMKAGASKEEITETLRVACHLSGIGTIYTASNALKDLFPG